MSGLAGIGYFYLRASDQVVPSVLVLRPEDFSDSAQDVDSHASVITSAGK
jgi:hypothetical protein